MQLGQLISNPYSNNIITAAFTPQTLVKTELDVEHMVIYDTIHLDPGDTVNENTSSFFTDVGPQSGKDLAQTNLELSQQLPTPEAFSIQAIGLRWFETIDQTDLFNLLINSAFEFLMGGKRYAIGPLTYYVPGGGIIATTTDLFGNGLAGPHPGSSAGYPHRARHNQPVQGALGRNGLRPAGGWQRRNRAPAPVPAGRLLGSRRQIVSDVSTASD